MVKHWHRLPRKLDASSSETFKVKLNVSLCNLIEMKHVPVLCRKGTWPLNVSSNSNFLWIYELSKVMLSKKFLRICLCKFVEGTSQQNTKTQTQTNNKIESQNWIANLEFWKNHCAFWYLQLKRRIQYALMCHMF